MCDFSSFIFPCSILAAFTIALLARGFAYRKLDFLWVGLQHDRLKIGIVVKASKLPAGIPCLPALEDSDSGDSLT
jgi:hypothetical protein